MASVAKRGIQASRATALRRLHVSTVRIKTVIEVDGELRVSNLPCRKGDQVEAIVIMPDDAAPSERQAARRRFLTRAQGFSFRSAASYPSRDQLHERD